VLKFALEERVSHAAGALWLPPLESYCLRREKRRSRPGRQKYGVLYVGV
jgi:hypothetical protein